ncbi:putative MARVEL domain-containing protein [Seiridium cardinale]|uniref:MARVEL domain-containing protein n=1 Tax=Seiridium cardinale TaxID=138064 RepID=A0ABR2XN90_9PEZI
MSVLARYTLWALSVFAIVASSIFVGVAVFMNAKNPQGRNKSPGCDNSKDPYFWQLLSQLLLQVLTVVCVFVPVFRTADGMTGLHRNCFDYSVLTSIIMGVAGVVLYSITCNHTGWLLSLLSSWISGVTGALAAALLAGEIERRTRIANMENAKLRARHSENVRLRPYPL